ncbi:hypothetical protein BDN67DRAFT_1012780 [Paxillus ammoniavirescens]|nr:hypothetical protein BDN67DRAFT_1012780 [Paxillus ammoniavirescens]
MQGDSTRSGIHFPTVISRPHRNSNPNGSSTRSGTHSRTFSHADQQLQTPQGAVRETVGVVEVAAGRDKTFWVVVAIPTYSAIEKILYTLIHCRRPEDPDEEVPTATGTNSSQTAANNAHAATTNQSGRPEMGDGAETPPIVAGNLVIRTQPRHSPAMRLSDETPGGEPHSSEFSGRNSQILNQFESIETVTIPETSTMSAHASLQPSPSTDRLSSMIPSCELPSSTTPVTSEPLTVPSPEEMALIEEYRRLKGESVVVRIAAEPLSGPAHGLDSCVPRDHSTSPSQSHDPITPSASSMPLPISRQTSLRINKGPLDITPALLSPSPLSASSRPPHSLHQPSITGDVQSLNLTASVGNTVVEARGNIKMVSSASPVADEADRQRDIFHLQKQNEQLRRQLNDAVAAMRKAEAERDGLATGTHHLITIYCTQVTNHSGSSPLKLGSAGAGPSSRQDGPPGGSELVADPQADHSAFSNVPSQGHPSGSAQFISGLIEAEKRVNKKMKENTPSDPTNKATDSSHSVHPPHRREPPGDDATTASSASTAADVANLQRGLLQMQEQLDQLRRRFDDPKH